MICVIRSRSLAVDSQGWDKQLVRKLDFMLIPWLTFLYLVSFLGKI